MTCGKLCLLPGRLRLPIASAWFRDEVCLFARRTSRDWGDFANQRRDMPTLANNLGVFLRRDGMTRQICEYHVSNQDYPQTRTREPLP
jgi:hypothetical protein